MQSEQSQKEEVVATFRDFEKEKMSFIKRWYFRRAMRRIKRITNKINKLHEEVGIMSKYQLKDGKLVRTESTIPRTQAGAPPIQRIGNPRQQPMHEEMPPFPLDDEQPDEMTQIQAQREHMLRQEQSRRQAQMQQQPIQPPQPPQSQIHNIMIAMMNGMQVEVPLEEDSIPQFVEELTEAIHAQRVYQINNTFVSTRNIVMFQIM